MVTHPSLSTKPSPVLAIPTQPALLPSGASCLSRLVSGQHLIPAGPRVFWAGPPFISSPCQAFQILLHPFKECQGPEITFLKLPVTWAVAHS